MEQQDWENLRKQLRTLVDIYTTVNDEISRMTNLVNLNTQDTIKMNGIFNNDWGNMKAQMKTLVDIYAESNNNIIDIKTCLKSIIKHLRKQEKSCAKKEVTKPKKSSKSSKSRR